MAVRQIADDAQADRAPVARRCFIAADPKTNLNAIRAILAARGIEATASYERPWIGARPLDTVMALIEDADLVIAVLNDPSSSLNLGFELGYAFAHDKKIMAILPRGSGAVPSHLMSTLYIQADPSETEGIVYNLDALLTAPQPSRRPFIPAKADTHPIGDLADELLKRLSVAVQAHDGLALERIVDEALRASGVSIVTSAQKGSSADTGPDLGIWSDDLESSVGNPFLIDLKMSMRGQSDLKNARKQVESYLSARTVDWGLLLYADGPPWLDGAAESAPPVLLLHVAELLSRLREESFAEIMTDLYSQAIRGA